MNRLTKTLSFIALACLSSLNFAASNTAPVSPAERAKIEEVVHQYLVNKPEVLVEAMQTLQRRQYEEA